MAIFSRVFKSSEMSGDTVVNGKGEDLGNIKEIMLDSANGRIAYAVLSFGGFLGLGDKLFAIPWEALAYDEEEDRFILNVAKEQLENAPGFDKDNWPDTADKTWATNVYSHYKVTPYWS